MTIIFVCTFQDSPLEKIIEIEKKKCKSKSGIIDEIADDLELTKKQFKIVDLPKQLNPKSENKIEIKIKSVCEDVIFLFPKKRRIIIENCNKMTFEDLMSNIKNHDIYFSGRCLVNDLQFHLFGTEIPFEDYCFSCVPKGKLVEVRMNGNVVILEYRGFQFILSENETVKTAIKLIKQKLENCTDIYLTDILHEKLEDDTKLRKKDNKNYLIEATKKFFFVSILSGQKNAKKMDFLTTVEEAKQYLATTNSFELELVTDDILIFDKNKKKLKEKENEKPLISIKSDDDTIFYDIPKLNEKIKKEEEDRKKAESKKAKEKAEEIKKAEEKIKAEAKKAKEKAEKLKKAKEKEKAEELKKAKEKEKAEELRKIEEKKIKKDLNKTIEKVKDSENLNVIRIEFIFEAKEDLNFESDIQVSASIEEIKKMITSLYSIEYDVIIKYKTRKSYIFCNNDDKINDIKKFLIQKGHYRLFVEIDETKKKTKKKIKMPKKVACDDDEESEDIFNKAMKNGNIQKLRKKKDEEKKKEEEEEKKRRKKEEKERRRKEEEEKVDDYDNDEEGEADLYKPFNQEEFKKIQKELKKAASPTKKKKIKNKNSSDDEVDKKKIKNKNASDDEVDLNKKVDPKTFKKKSKIKKEEIISDDEDEDEEDSEVDLTKPLDPKIAEQIKNSLNADKKKSKSAESCDFNKIVKPKESNKKPTSTKKDKETAKEDEDEDKEPSDIFNKIIKPKTDSKKPKSAPEDKSKDTKPKKTVFFTFKFVYGTKTKKLKLDCESILSSHEEEIKEIFGIEKDNKLDFFIKHYEDDDDEPIDSNESNMKKFKYDSILVEVHEEDVESFLSSTKRSVKVDGRGLVDMQTYFYRTNQESDEDKNERIELESTAKVIDMKRTIQKIKGVKSLSNIKILFAGKDLLNDIELKSLKIGSEILYVYIRPEIDYFCTTAAALHITLTPDKNDDDDDNNDSSSSS